MSGQLDKRQGARVPAAVLPTEEEIARVIDPEAWRIHEYQIGCAADRDRWASADGLKQAAGFRRAAQEVVSDSRAKAREILALFSRSGSGE